ncbi:hypothetical protein ABLE91_10980 [Aquabacter sp. CN5-332]|uniref:hypothetical protein n=1 Tax=Aquabacter sp. CN5-332 TaxID=3156608 RepID=UPI0032B61771
MPATHTSTFTQGLSISQVEGENLSVDTASQALAVSTGPTSSEEESMALQLGGDATAVGENTLATANVTATVSGNEDVQSAYGSAAFSAWGSGPADAGVFATAVSYGAVYGDADYGFSLNYTSESSSQNGDTIEWESTSITEVFALDIDGVPTQSSDASDSAAQQPPPEDPQPEPSGFDPDWAGCGCDPIDDWGGGVDGNVAIFDVFAEAVGDNSLVEVEVAALTVEDQLSTVTVVATGAIG